MVDIFRNSEAAADVVDDILELPVLPKTIWMQLGVINEIAAEKARAKGIDVVMDRCPKIELLRLGLKGPKSRV
jgi:predicted CoA-binding protein